MMTFQFTRRWARVAVPVVLLVLSGCGGAYDSTVIGKVTLEGAVVPRGSVAFHPVSGGPTAYGSIKENGDYDVCTGREKGLPAGEYQVTVTANEPSAAQSAKGGPPPPGKPIAPLWYRTKETSSLKFHVEPGNNTIDLDLTSQPPAGWKPPGRK
jgi:hypothetical protein